MSLLYRLNDMVKYVCVCYMGLESNGCFVTGTTLMDDHYKTYIISGVGVMSRIAWYGDGDVLICILTPLMTTTHFKAVMVKIPLELHS